jgi:putative heme iron utilization protein
MPLIKNKKLREQIENMVKEDPNKNVYNISREMGLPERAVMECLPGEMAWRVKASAFDEITEEVATWGPVLIAKGFYNIIGREGPAGGHFKIDHLSAIYFVEKPFMGLPSLSIQFFNLKGDPMFKVYVGRDKDRKLLPEQEEKFKQLRSRFE